MTLLDLLAADLLGRLAGAPDDSPRRVLLWLDPEGQFRRLADHIEPVLVARGAQLLRYDLEAGMGQVGLKLALLRLGAGDERAVVYLPGFGRTALQPHPDGGPPALWGVYEFRFVGRVWGLANLPPGDMPEPPTLLAWLKRHGFQVADARTTRELTRGGADSLLARYAERQREEPPERWPRPLRHSDVLEALAGDPRDALRRLLVAPKNEVARWGVERPLVLERVAAEYGLVLEQGDRAAGGGGTAGNGESPKAKETRTRLEHAPPPPTDPEELADRLVVQLALAEAWDAFGRPADFPFLARLPDRDEHRRRSVRFLREDVLGHTSLGPSFLGRVARLEPGCNLVSWATGRSGQPAALPLLASTRWRRFLERFDAAADRSWQEAGNLLLAERDTVRAGLGAAWDRVDGETFWFVLADLADLVEGGERATTEAASLGAARALVDAYAERWWVVDNLHLRVRAACARVPGLERVRRVADLACFEYAAGVNQRFDELVEAEIAWPPGGCRGVDRLRTALWSADGGRRAVIVSDACRWDLARCLREKLPYDCELTPTLTTLPTTTPFGMTALLPLDERPLSVEFRAQGLSIRQGGSHNLATRDGRRAFLEAALAGRSSSPPVQFVDMDDLLRGQAVPNAPLVVVFDNTIDEQGHKGTEELPGLVEPFVGNLKRTIDRLHEAGVAAVHLVTDHGFLLLPPDAVDALGQPEALPAQTLAKDERWAALKTDAPVSELVRRPLPLAPDIQLGFARGVRTLVKAPGFLHGGISLQECVIPHLASRTSLPRARVGLDLRVSTDKLSVGTVPAILRPSNDQTQPPLGGLEPITVRLWVETAPAAGVPTRRVTDPIEVELRPEVEELRPPVYLREGLGLRTGQGLLLRALDAENGQDLGSVPLTLLVNWD